MFSAQLLETLIRAIGSSQPVTELAGVLARPDSQIQVIHAVGIFEISERAIGGETKYIHLISQQSYDNRKFIYSLNKAKKKLKSFKILKKDWDSYGADTIDESIIDKAANIIEFVKIASQTMLFPKIRANVAPLTDGGVEVYFHGRHDELRITMAINNSYINRIENFMSDDMRMMIAEYSDRELMNALKWLTGGEVLNVRDETASDYRTGRITALAASS